MKDYTYYELFKKEDYAGALENLLNKSAEEQSDSVIQFFIGDCYYELCKFDEAIKYYSKVIEADHKFKGNAYFNRGLCWKAKDEFEKSLSDFLNAGPEHKNVMFHIGELHTLMGNFEESYKVLSGLTGVDRHRKVIAFLASDCNQLDKHEESLELFMELFTLGDRSEETLNGIITELNWLEREDELRKFMEEVLCDANDPSGTLRDKARYILENLLT